MCVFVFPLLIFCVRIFFSSIFNQSNEFSSSFPFENENRNGRSSVGATVGHAMNENILERRRKTIIFYFDYYFF